MKLVKCISKRESVPEQIKEGNIYYIDETSFYRDPVDCEEYAEIYKDKWRKQYIGRLSTKHFCEPVFSECDNIINTKIFVFLDDDDYEIALEDAVSRVSEFILENGIEKDDIIEYRTEPFTTERHNMVGDTKIMQSYRIILSYWNNKYLL